MIWDTIKDALSGVGGVGGKSGVLSILTEAEMLDDATVNVVAGKWTTIGTYQVVPQTSQKCGAGVSGRINEQIGMLYVLLKDNQTSPVEVPCSIRIAILDNQDRVRAGGYVVHSVRNDKLSVDKTDINVGYKFPVQGIEARPYDKIALIVNTDADVTIVRANSDIRLDTTLYA